MVVDVASVAFLKLAHGRFIPLETALDQTLRVGPLARIFPIGCHEQLRLYYRPRPRRKATSTGFAEKVFTGTRRRLKTCAYIPEKPEGGGL